jgi:hypothetical protein
MGLTLPNAPNYYSQTDQSATRREIEREDALNAKNNADAIFNDLIVTQLTVNGAVVLDSDLHVFGNVQIDGNLTVNGTADFSTGLLKVVAITINAATFTINGTTASRTSVILAFSSQNQGLFFGSPVSASGFMTPRAIAMSDLPDYVVLGAPDSTIVTVANNAAANVPLGQILSIPANSLAIGDCIRLTCRGVYGDTTTAPNLTLAVLSGPGGVICTTGANAVGAVSLANRGWEVRANFIVTALGALTGKLEAQGVATLSTSAIAAQIVDMENTGVITFNTTIANSLQLCVTWGTAAAANTIACRQTLWEVLKST